MLKGEIFLKKRTFVLLISFLIFFEIWNILLFFTVPDNRKVGIVILFLSVALYIIFLVKNKRFKT
ncbi:hypothetical protein BW721_09450 [Jeotgalibaca sp. PTS2502]|nr:hypothetical protein BW721_09450 [Jeotgalibaca sp. PTS2502]